MTKAVFRKFTYSTCSEMIRALDKREYLMIIFVSPAKQKPDICIAFPAASLSAVAAAVA